MKKNFKILTFCFSTSLFWFCMYAYVPVMSPYAESLGATHKMIGLIVGAYGFVQMILRIPLGILSDRIKKRKLFIIVGSIFCAVSSLGMWYSTNALHLLFFRALTGVGAATWVIFTVLYASYFDKQESSKALGILTSFNYFGQVIAMLISGVIAQQFGQRYTFLLAFAGGVLGLILSFNISENNEIDSTPVSFKDILDVARDHNLLTISFIAVISQIITHSTIYGFVPIAAKQIGASDFQLGMLTMLSTIPGVFASAMSGTFFTKNMGERNSVVMGFIITAATCAVIPFIKDVTILIITQIIGGFGRGLVYPLLMSLSIKNVEYHKRATAMGFFQAIYALGMFIGPVMVGALSDMAGLSWGFAAVGATSVAGAYISGIYIKNSRLVKLQAHS